MQEMAPAGINFGIQVTLFKFNVISRCSFTLITPSFCQTFLHYDPAHDKTDGADRNSPF